jgi:hypothetical protein
MNIKMTPSAVAFDYSKDDSEAGLLIENCDSYDLLKEVCSQGVSPEDTYQKLQKHKANVTKIAFRVLS